MIKSKIKFMFLLFSFLFLFSTKDSYSQTSIHSVGFDIGTISSFDPNFSTDDWIVLPEIFISGDLFTSNFNWKANFGYWNDGINESKLIDAPTYSYSSFVFGADLLYLLPITKLNRPSPVRILSGLSYHYVNSKEIESHPYWPDYSKKVTGNLFYFNAGMEVHILLHRSFTLLLKGISYYLLNNREIFEDNRWRLQLSLGLNYNFKL